MSAEIFFSEPKSGDMCIVSEPMPRLFRFWDISQKIFSLMGDDKLVASPNDSNSTGKKKESSFFKKKLEQSLAKMINEISLMSRIDNGDVRNDCLLVTNLVKLSWILGSKISFGMFHTLNLGPQHFICVPLYP
uniref:Uncharacterized protein n=1 Tax=Micrurus spixii TaxID=129469 RepID=A0A2D4LH84_9SAUR